jgi:hypothetical protein
MSLGQRRSTKKLSLMYDVEHRNVPNYIHVAFYEFRNPRREERLRNNQDYRLPANVSNRFIKSVVPDSIRHWNSHPAEIKSCYSRNSF